MERKAWSGWLVATTPGGARIRLIYLHKDRRGDIRLKRKGAGTTADQLVCTTEIVGEKTEILEDDQANGDENNL